ncbi:hypothetical protein DXA21_21520 [Parabacteroides distasonis]|nr:hypothetical protein DXA21_21520 [Parabacteroides distasonis]
MEYCIECGSPYAECHHVFFGSFQKKYSDRFKLYIPLCAEHHRGKNSPHKNRGLNCTFHCVQSITEEKTAHTRTEKRTWNIKRWRRDNFEENIGDRKDFKRKKQPTQEQRKGLGI